MTPTEPFGLTYEMIDEPTLKTGRKGMGGRAIPLPNMTELPLTPESGLYPDLLGDSWSTLGDAVRRFHASGPMVQAAGVFRVCHGSSWLTRTLARLIRLPAAGEAVEVQLAVVARGDGEEWRRSFAGRPLVSFQSAGPDGLLTERMGLVELRFRLTVVARALRYETTGAAICLGRLRLPLPLRLSPRVKASEHAVAGSDQIAVAVEVRLPLLGSLITYGGHLAQCEVQG